MTEKLRTRFVARARLRHRWCAATRRARRDPRAGARQGQRRDLHQDRSRESPGRRAAPAGPAGRPEERRQRRAAAQGARRGHAAASWSTSSTRCSSLQRGKELGYKLSDEQFKSVLDNIKKDNKIETEEQFQAALKQENMTMADLRRNLERQMIIPRVRAERGAREGRPSPTRRRAGLLRGAPRASSPRRRRSRCARFWCRVPSDPKGVNVGLDDEARGEGRADSRARRRRRELRKAGGGCVRRRRRGPTRGLIGPISLNDLSPDLREADRADEGRRRQPGAAHAARLSDPEARVVDRAQTCRSNRRASRSASASSPASGRRSSRNTWTSCAPGDHRVEERGHQEGVRGGARAAQSRRAG